MDASGVSRRGFLAGSAALGLSGVLTGCVGSGSSGAGGDGSDTLTLQSGISDAKPKAALAAVVKGFDGPKTTVNTVAVENFRAQLPTYLTSSNPPDVLAWLAGSVARDYASRGLLLDVSDLWKGDGVCAGFSETLRDLSTAEDGKQIFIPTNYYWWGVFYRKSAFDEWGLEPPKTWDEFLALCRTLQKKDVMPLSMGTGSTPWVASSWFDYLDLRINGRDFHIELLSGEHSFDSPEVRTVMDEYARILPFLDPRGRSYSWQEAVTPLMQQETAMYLIGSFITQTVPEDALGDFDFFRFPVIDRSVPLAEEVPTDGFFASAGSDNPEGAKKLLTYLAEPDSQQEFIEKSGSSNLPTSPEVGTSNLPPLVQKGIKFVDEVDEVTQFFNRDSTDELQATADTALTRFIDQPDDVGAILREWQAAAKRVLST